jgi:hypothetical protein
MHRTGCYNGRKRWNIRVKNAEKLTGRWNCRWESYCGVPLQRATRCLSPMILLGRLLFPTTSRFDVDAAINRDSRLECHILNIPLRPTHGPWSTNVENDKLLHPSCFRRSQFGAKAELAEDSTAFWWTETGGHCHHDWRLRCPSNAISLPNKICLLQNCPVRWNSIE